MNLFGWFRERHPEATYMEQIQVLKADRPMVLPPVKPLHAIPAPKAKRSRTKHPVLPMARRA